MAKPVIDSVQTKGVGFAPILKLYCKKCEISQIIDDYLPLDPRKKIFSHGQAYVELVTAYCSKFFNATDFANVPSPRPFWKLFCPVFSLNNILMTD